MSGAMVAPAGDTSLGARALNGAAALRGQFTRQSFALSQLASSLLPAKVALPDNDRFAMIGILGGMGPAAGNDTAAKLVSYAQQQKDCPTDQEVPEYMVASYSKKINDRTGYLLKEVLPKTTGKEKEAALLAATPSNPYWGMQHSADKLQAAGAQVIMMPCNTAHGWFDQLKVKPGVQKVHIVDSVVAAIDKDPALRGRSIKVGLMATSGTIQCGIYTARLEKLGRTDIQFVVPDADVQKEQVMGGIYGLDGDARKGGIKGGDMEAGGVSHLRLKAAGEHLIKDKGADVLSYSCTEIPLVLGEKDFEKDFSVPGIDATKAMVHKAVDVAEDIKTAARQPAAEAARPRAAEDAGHPLRPFGFA
jgi:aspartate racemase